MCGISGIISKQRTAPETVWQLVRVLRHRGPDAEAIYQNEGGTVSLGHNRLSIIDLSQRANQPMRSQDGRFVIVFNGEIYNFKNLKRELENSVPGIFFQTNSDTEIILHCFSHWGINMVHRLEGMFAFVIYDVVAEKIFLFRDRIGKKPLFYYCDGNRFIFASEIKALLLHPAVAASKEIDKQAIHEFLHLGYIPEPKTIYRSVRKFPAGSVGEVSRNLSLSISPFWKVQDCLHPSGKPNNDKDVIGSLRTKLHESVRKRLISDVPLGAFLSGGTDSSLVTAIASKYTAGPIQTFSIGFKENKFDEHRYAEQVASVLKTDHHQYILSETEAAGILETYLRHLDEPFADTSAIPTMLVSSLARKKVTVALTGDGGDELFLGYGTYAWANRLVNPLFRIVQQPLAYGLRNFGNNRYKRIARLLKKVEPKNVRSHIFSQEQYFFSDEELMKLLKLPLAYESFWYNDPESVLGASAGEKQALFDLKYYLKDDLLVKVDRASMFYGLECRCPFLDHELVEYALNIPTQLKLKESTGKWILKELLKEYLPESLVYRQKWGFSIPLSKWLKNEFRYLTEKFLSPSVINEVNLVNPTFSTNLLTSFRNGEDYLYNRVWILIVLHKWMKENT